MLQFFFDSFSNCAFLAVFFLSMVPTLENKVAIPFGLSKFVWGENALPVFSACFWAGLGCFLPSLLVFRATRILRNKTFGVLIEKISSKYKNKIHNEISDFKKCLFISMFVAIPLPLTGVYSGAVIAALSNLNFWKSFCSLLAGEAISCLIVAIFSVCFKDSSVVLVVAICLILIVVLYEFLKYIFKRIKQNKEIEIK